jgi:hypothetical protein
MAQVVEHLSGKCKTLSSNFYTSKKKIEVLGLFCHFLEVY